MPKETVFSTDLIEDDRGEWPGVILTWSREHGHVQLVTRRFGYEVAPASRNKDGFPDCRYGQYVTLDRRGINDLIRYLRRARDQAFGKDE